MRMEPSRCFTVAKRVADRCSTDFDEFSAAICARRALCPGTGYLLHRTPANAGGNVRRNVLARPLAQEAEKPEQQDDRQRDPDEPEKTTFQHDNLHFPAQERQLRAVGSTCTVPALLAGASGANAVTQSVA